LTINHRNLDIILDDLKDYKNSKLLVVSKNQSINDIIDLNNRGFRLFGENRVQEAKEKFQKIQNRSSIDLHLIGPLQRNKVKIALQLFDVIQTIDRVSLIDTLVKELPNLIDIKTREYFIQINIGDESQKGGVSKKDLFHLYDYCLQNKLNISGLMCIPPNDKRPDIYFEEMVFLRDKIDKKLKLSMGMSNDYKVALNCQSNFIRVGSKIFE
tara:strand:+ start:662 stop:1297 length:636 start_codon:yes stop_codon:yes gene_type:complete